VPNGSLCSGASGNDVLLSTDPSGWLALPRLTERDSRPSLKTSVSQAGLKTHAELLRSDSNSPRVHQRHVVGEVGGVAGDDGELVLEGGGG
jgi:hypothetical protein